MFGTFPESLGGRTRKNMRLKWYLHYAWLLRCHLTASRSVTFQISRWLAFTRIIREAIDIWVIDALNFLLVSFCYFYLIRLSILFIGCSLIASRVILHILSELLRLISFKYCNRQPGCLKHPMTHPFVLHLLIAFATLLRILLKIHWFLNLKWQVVRGLHWGVLFAVAWNSFCLIYWAARQGIGRICWELLFWG